MSQREIACRLNYSQSTMLRATKDITIDTLVPRPKHPRAPRRTSNQGDRLFVCTAIKEWKITLPDIINVVSTSVSRPTILRCLTESGIKSYTAYQKLFLKPEHLAK